MERAEQGLLWSKVLKMVPGSHRTCHLLLPQRVGLLLGDGRQMLHTDPEEEGSNDSVIAPVSCSNTRVKNCALKNQPEVSKRNSDPHAARVTVRSSSELDVLAKT